MAPAGERNVTGAGRLRFATRLQKATDRAYPASMTTVQKLTIRLSEVRQKLNELSAVDEPSNEQRSEMGKLTAEYPQLEERHRAALTAQGDEEAKAQGEHVDADGEATELRRIMDRVSLSDYLTRAAGGVGLVGAPAELAAALEVPTIGAGGGVAIPWAVLADGILMPEQRADTERRAFTSTAQLDGPVMQRPILQRLFGMDIADALGVRIDTVPTGRSEWPLLNGTSAVAPVHKAEGTAADAAVAASFTTETLKPKRLTGRYEFTHEQGAQVADIEQALRRDLADAVSAKMNDQLINGSETQSTPEQVDGFATTITAPGDAGATAVYADYAGAHAQAVDGLHASMETEVASVIGVDVYKHAATVYQTGSGESGSEALRRRGMRCMASPFVGAAAGSGQHKLNLFHAAGPNGGGIMRGDSVAAVWPTLEVIRDIYTQASVGVVLTWVTLWDAQTAFRAGAYSRLAFDIT